MPGQLREDALCPECGGDLIALVDTASRKKVVREFFHDVSSLSRRRRSKCVKVYQDYDVAQAERRALEVKVA